MVFISKILFFMSHHGFLTVVFLFIIFGGLSALTKKWYLLGIAFILSIGNVIGGQFLNAWFLNKYGTESTAVITSDVETSSTLNDRYIHDYEAIVKKQNGSYVTTFFSTTTAAIYPIENAIRIPRKETRFPVKFIPGYEKNIVILYDRSDEGKMLLKYEKRKPVEKARIQYEADPGNPEFISHYRSALQNYLKEYDDPEYRERLNQLENRSF
ncbi:hypothetical protein [uncultured Chryseobacterium sp.]|uniref:hypothetical protein n=1 Tax=uncultured Chryseobacterium sp. TaxID=259322 RepID=UPI0025ED3474|nr:hypothetical protein [uncultured Chryseobacterium sp.]